MYAPGLVALYGHIVDIERDMSAHMHNDISTKLHSLKQLRAGVKFDD